VVEVRIVVDEEILVLDDFVVEDNGVVDWLLVQGHWYKILQSWSFGSKKDPTGHGYSVCIKDPFRSNEHKKYVVQVTSLGLTKRPFSEQTKSSTLSWVARQTDVVVVEEMVDDDGIWLVVVSVVLVKDVVELEGPTVVSGVIEVLCVDWVLWQGHW
jgi:hypothetical protein